MFQYLDNRNSDDFTKAVFYFKWAPLLSRNGQIEASKRMRHKGLSISKKLNSHTLTGNFLITLSNFYVNLSVVDSATYYVNETEKLIQLHPELSEKGLWQIYQTKANIEGISGNKEGQALYYEKAWDEFKDRPPSSKKGYFLYVITYFFNQSDDFEKRSYYTDELAKYYKEKELKTPDFHFPVESAILTEITPKTINDLKHVIKISDSLNNLNSLSACTITLARAYLKTDRAIEAIPFLKHTIKKLSDANYPYNHSTEWNLLKEAYLDIDDYRNAFISLDGQKSLEDSLRKIQVLNKVADYKVKYETEHKERQLVIKESELQKKQANQKLLLWILSFALSTLIFGVYFYNKIKKKNILLDKQKALLETAIGEKNILLKETHHRVKNSFQIVSSLLFLQSKNVKDKEAKLAIQEAQNRVRSMVLIHQKLYNKDKLVGIDAQDYFKDLIKDIFESHQQKSNGLNYQLNIQPMVLSIETITPIGLILNELIVNVLKHAFAEVTSKSLLQIDFEEKDNELSLKVKDNGDGFEGDINESSFGIKLIKALAKKLKAKVEFNSSIGKGTQAILNITKFEVL